jgi:penicillin-binding protein 1A
MKLPEIQPEAIREFFQKLPQKTLSFFRHLPGAIVTVIKDPKLRRKWFFRGVYAFTGFLALLLFIFLITWMGIFGSIPKGKELLAISQPEASKIYSHDGKLMGKYYTKNRNTLEFEDLPPAFMTALIATEDSRFWSHSGIDFRSWMRVLVKRMILGQKSAGGGSTLSQQLAKNLFPRKDFLVASMLINKYREFIIATRLEKVYSKEDLLTFYINTVPFGENIFGLDAAADRYYSKTADQLNIEQCAMLVGLLKATGYYNPNNYPERAITRRNVVLYQMMVNSVIDSITYDSLANLPLNLSYQRNTDSEGIALYFRNQIRPVLLEWCATHKKENGQPYDLYTDGLKVYTTIDFGMQEYAEQALKSRMSKLQKIFDEQFTSWKPYEAAVNDAVLRSQRYNALMESGLPDSLIMDSLNQPLPMQFWTWEGLKDTLASPMDSIRHALKTLQGSLVAIHPQTGGILTWVGGNDAEEFNIDYLLTPRHPGSAFKPILYATALDQGIALCTYYANEQITYDDYEGWTPGNADGTYGNIYSLPGALAKSINTVAAQLIFDVGIDNVIKKARLLGITGEMKPVPSLALGTAEVTLVELVSAYSTFLNKGMHRPYQLITRIEDQDGNVLETFKPAPATSVFTPETCGMMNQMLANVVDSGTAASLRYREFGIRGAIAGKTGTTQFNSDGVFVGMTPKFVAGAWVGCFDRRVRFKSTSRGQGAKTALPIWGEFVQKMQADPQYKSLFQPSWPNEYKWVNDCAFMIDSTELELLEPEYEMEGDTLTSHSKRYKLKGKQRKGIGRLLQDIFGNKDQE